MSPHNVHIDIFPTHMRGTVMVDGSPATRGLKFYGDVKDIDEKEIDRAYGLIYQSLEPNLVREIRKRNNYVTA